MKVSITIETEDDESADDAIIKYINNRGLFDDTFKERFNGWASRDAMLNELAGLVRTVLPLDSTLTIKPKGCWELLQP